MLIYADDTDLGGVIRDTDRRDILHGGDGADSFRLLNDGRTDTVMGLEDGIDLIDITAFDASWDQLMIRQISLTEYVVNYQDEERLRIVFNEPVTVPESGVLLDETDFIFRSGLPESPVQLINERSATEKEVIFGTSLPDVFVFENDGQRDTIRRFEPGKDEINLAAYGTSFYELDIQERKQGRIAIAIPIEDDRPDWLVVIDISRQLTAEDITADMFIF